VLGAVLVGCQLSDFEVEAEAPSGTGAAAVGGSGALDGGGNGPGGSGGAGNGAGGSVGAGGQGAAGGALGGGGAGGTPPVPTSCVDVVGPSGLYAIDPDGDGNAAPFTAYCEQDIESGGWTLIARSEAGANGDMGWGVSRGVVTGTEAYSLDPVTAGLTIDMLLLVSRESEVQAYTIDVPDNFVADFDQSAWDTTSDVTHVTGSCTPGGGKPKMLNFAGFTGRQDVFFFRDQGSTSIIFGFGADGFSLNKAGCEDGGGLHNEQGELFVR